MLYHSEPQRGTVDLCRLEMAVFLHRKSVLPLFVIYVLLTLICQGKFAQLQRCPQTKVIVYT